MGSTNLTGSNNIKHNMLTFLNKPEIISIPTLSAYQQVWRNFDFNRTTLEPSRCKVVVHERAMERGVWAHRTGVETLQSTVNKYAQP